MIREFKEFIQKGNVLDLAVGVIMGAAFGKIVSSLVNDIIMPPIGLLLGNVDFSNLFITLRGETFKTLADAQAAGAVTINYGVFLNSLIEFLIIAFALFLIIKQVNRMNKEEEDSEEPTTKICPQCFTSIPIKAKRCPHCTSELYDK